MISALVFLAGIAAGIYLGRKLNVAKVKSELTSIEQYAQSEGLAIVARLKKIL